MQDTQTIDQLKVMSLLDSVIPQYLELTKMSIKSSVNEIARICGSLNDEKRLHILDQWKSKEGEFAQFYLNCDQKIKRLFLEHFGFELEEEKYRNYQDMFMAQLDGIKDFDLHPFQTVCLDLFLLMANNNSLELVRDQLKSEELWKAVEDSKIDRFGNGTNWGSYYKYLMDGEIEERSLLVENVLTSR